MKAIITGVGGQDGSYLAEFLIRKNYEVHGIMRRTSNLYNFRLDNILNDRNLSKSLKLHFGDINDPHFVANLIHLLQPAEVYNLAAQSHVFESFSYPYQTSLTNSMGLVNILESIKNYSKESKIYQASTSELFGNTLPQQNEESLMQPQSPYAVSKLFSYWLIKNYREAYNIFAVNGILFNHESPRRTSDFVTRKITLAASSIFHGKQTFLKLGNLNSKRDWGYAPEFVVGLWKTLQQSKSDDYVLSTGKSHSVKEFLDFTFKNLNLNWEDYVQIDSSLLRPKDVDHLEGDSTKAFNTFGWKPKISCKELAKIMLEHDLRLQDKNISKTDVPDYDTFE
jgi:GDPmannose 4,6-dehydratase